MLMRISIPRSTSSLSSITFFFIHYSPTTKVSPKPLLSRASRKRTLASAMASTGDSENISTAIAIDDADDAFKYGFKRDEMYQKNLADTVDPYDRHVFLCYKSHESWPSRVENSDSDLLPMVFSVALKARKSDIKVKTRLTICEGRNDMGLSDGDVLVFPEMTKYRNLKESVVDSFVEDVLVNGNPWAGGMQEVLTGSYIFVCAHNQRDRRCGVCGPILIEKFKEEIESKGLTDQVFVTACSHVGGHKYAGNVIIFGADAEGKIAGHWYGYVTPEDVPQLLDQHIGKGEIIEHLLRGKMGARVEKADDMQNQKVANGASLNNREVKPQETGSDESKESISSCCQGSKGFTCCRDGSSDEKVGTNVLGKLSNWFGKWEQRDVLTAVAVTGAMAVVAVAYGSYRKSK